MKKIKKGLALLLCVAMAVSCAACGSDDGGTTTTGGSGGTTQGGGTSDDGTREEVTLTMFSQQSVTSESGIWQGWGAQKLYEDLTIKLDLYPTGNEVEQKLNQYLAGGSLPDIIGFKGLDQAQLAMDADMLLPLDEYKELLPNIFENSYYEDAVGYSQ